MKKTIYFHIGHPKCGSSSIQAFCEEHRDELLEDGYFYPPTSNLKFHGEISPTFYKSAGQADQSSVHLPRMLRAIRESAANKIILSCEAFYQDDTQFFNAFAEFDLQFVYYIRRQEDYFESQLNQRIKEGHLAHLYNVKERQMRRSQLDFLNYIEKFAAGFGPTSITVRILDIDLFVDGDLIQDFLFSIGNSNRKKYAYRKPDNASLHGIYLKFAVHLALVPLTTLERRRITFELIRLSSEIQNKDKVRLLDEIQRAQLRELYRNDNKIISARFLLKYAPSDIDSYFSKYTHQSLLLRLRWLYFRCIKKWFTPLLVRQFCLTTDEQRQIFMELSSEALAIIRQKGLTSKFDKEAGISYPDLPELPLTVNDFRYSIAMRDTRVLQVELATISASYQAYSTPVLIDVFNEFNIVVFREKFYGIPKTMSVNWGDFNSYGMAPEILCCLTVPELRKAVLE